LTEPLEAPTPAPVGGDLKEQVIDRLRTCFDPEIPVNIYDLGLIYGVDVSPEGNVVVRMTLTSPMCPVAGSLPGEVQAKVSTIPGIPSVKVDLVWDPPWRPEMMGEAAKLQLGWMV
jgi:FeS assembly SUF system protein